MRLVLVGGGTGGHFYPLIAVAEEFRARPIEQPELYYLGPDAFDRAELDRLGVTFVACPAGKRRRYFSWQNFIDPFKVIMGFFVALAKLYLIMPDAVFSKGSFTSVPVLYAARFLRIPIIIHESDAIAGRANLLMRGAARAIGIAYPEASEFFPKDKTALVGIPLRRALRTPPTDPFAALSIPHDKPLLLVTGGSLGAEFINNLLLQTLPVLLSTYRVFHLCGKDHFDTVRLTAKSLITDTKLLECYYLEKSVDAPTMAALLAAADLIVSRSGSSAIHEIAYFKKPAILIPIPETVSRDQRTNAYAYARSGAASVLEQGNLTPQLLRSEITAIMSSPDRYTSMTAAATSFALPSAAAAIADLITTIGIEHES
jgi:UDP-N-acetylglucosamine--N-acetylmuramyl-(pentapeptide) pyrophosphoryl-undecaprenol N-acetylglucosamine transferase